MHWLWIGSSRYGKTTGVEVPQEEPQVIIDPHSETAKEIMMALEEEEPENPNEETS